MASYFSWTRAAYVFFVLSLLAALLKIGGSSLAEPRSFVFASPKEPEATTTVETTTQERTTERTVERARDPRPGATAPETTASATTVVETTTTAPPKPAPAVPVRNGAAPAEDPPVFYRPSARIPERDASSDGGGSGVSGLSAGPVCGDLGGAPKSSRAVFPLSDTFFDSYSDTWGAPRPQGGHEGADLMTPFNTPEYAITDGTIVPVSGADDNGWNTLGGYTVMLRADYDVGPIKAGDLFYYAHMNRESTLKIGTRVRAGQVVGVAGDTGNGPPVTRRTMPSHLHFGWYDASGARTNLNSGAMNPYPLLEWLKANGGAVAGGSDVEYCEAPQPPAPVPSTGGNTWTYPTSPGTRPDMDTGTGDARPSPVVEKPSGSAERAPGVEREKPPRRDAPRDEEGPKPAAPEPEKPAAPDLPRPAVDVEPPIPPDRNIPPADEPRTDAPRADAPRADAPRADAPRVDAPRAVTPPVDPPRNGIEGSVDRRNPAPPSVSSIRDWVTDLLNPAPRDGDKKKRPDRDRGQDPRHDPEDKARPDKRQKDKPNRPKNPRPPVSKTEAGCDTPGGWPCGEETPTPEEKTREETTREETTREETTAPVTAETTTEATTQAPPESEGGFVPESTQAPEPSVEPEGTTPQ